MGTVIQETEDTKQMLKEREEMEWHTRLKCQEFAPSGITWYEGSNDVTKLQSFSIFWLLSFLCWMDPQALYIVVR